ncbi:methylmalonyl-CoA mutase family protein [Spirosoma sp. SC4-14]|uniref:methylmalonyl-CoA mutase family protein n=1 Tax=Spirosoma sp. SC4-14 TaxID=3128900 RepID=UPI0030CD7F39
MESLFSEIFPAADKSVWLNQVLNESKPSRAGTSESIESIYEALRWPTAEGFTVEPYYTPDDLASLPLHRIQQAQKQTPGWLTAPTYTVTDEKAGNLAIHQAIQNGADALVLSLKKRPALSSDMQLLARLLDGIKLSETPIFFKTNDALKLVETLDHIAPYQIKGGLLYDLPNQSVQEYGQTIATVTRATASSPHFYTICASSHSFHNAGATASQELAFTLAYLADLYDYLTDSGLSIEQLIAKTMLSVAVGTSYFMEIAKLRALRVLFNRLCSFYTPGNPGVFVHAQTSTFYNATATPYTNMLRATAEAMAAVVGGCNALTIPPYDTVLGQSGSEFSDRIARNISILLKEESHLDKVADPSAGAYYIESLTNQLTESAWLLFLDVEKQGGYEQTMTSGFIKQKIDQAYQTKVEAIRNGNVIVGVTKFRSDEGISVNIAEETKADSLPVRRLASEFE